MTSARASTPDGDRPETPTATTPHPVHGADGHDPTAPLGPALESARGRAWSTITWLGFGAVLLVLPLLAVVADGGGFRDPVPFDTGWWLLGLLGVVGAIATIAGALRLVRLLLAGARAAEHGSGLLTFAAVAVGGDTERLLAAEPPYARLGPGERAWQTGVRVAAAAAYLLAVVWLPMGLALSTRLAAHGRLEAGGVRLLTLAPAALLVLCAVLCRAFDRALLRHARRTSRAAAGSDRPDAENGRAAGSGDSAGDGAAGASTVPFAGARLRPRPFRIAAGAVGLAMASALAPLVGLVAASASAPVVGSVFSPARFDGLWRRAAFAEVFRSYRLAPDSAVTPEAAGAALRALRFVGRSPEMEPFERGPRPIFERGWFPDEVGRVVGTQPHRFAVDLFERVVEDGLDVRGRAALEQVAAHPAHREFETAARASSADVLGARWTLPLPDGLAAVDVRFSPAAPLRHAADAHIAKAALQLDRGRIGAAERAVREVISVGFLFLDDGPTPIDVGAGASLVSTGAAALTSLYRAAGRVGDARAIERARAAAERAVAILDRRGGRYRSAGVAVADIPSIVDDADAPRGIRWAMLGWYNTVGPCVDGRRLVFGPGGGYAAWLERARRSLVRSPAEAALFELMRRGELTARNGRVAMPGWPVTVLRLAVGREEAGRCGQLINGLLGA